MSDFDKLHPEQKLEPHLAALYDLLAIRGDVTRSLPELIKSALVSVMNATSARVGIVHLFEAENSLLSLVAKYDNDSWLDPGWNSLPMHHPLISKILGQRGGLVLAAPFDMNIFANLNLAGPASQLLGISIREGPRSLGTLTVLLGQGEFNTLERQLFATLANQLAIIIGNAHFREQAGQLLIIEERNRLARELHDSVTQALYSTTLFAEAAQRHAQAGNIDKTKEYLAELGETSQQALKEMRLLLHRLRPSPLEKSGLIEALRQRLKAVEGRAGIHSELNIAENLHIPRELEAPLYFLAQEALNNSLKHSRATEVNLEFMESEENIIMTVADNGKGFDIELAKRAGGLGLISMREHTAQLNGLLKLTSSPDIGSKVIVSVPIPASRENFLP